MEKIIYIDRETGQKTEEKVYGQKALSFLYGKGFVAKFFSIFFLPLFCKVPFISKFYGFLQKTKKSKKKIVPFIKKFEMDISEFKKDVPSFASFNDFFIRELKKEARPISNSKAILPADARYLFFQDISKLDHFFVKDARFDLSSFLNSKELADEYDGASMVFARLCPTDYHRFHFPIDCTPGDTKLINGSLYSVNPIALKKDLSILWQNKRVLTFLQSGLFGQVLFLEIGATCVGTIHQTYTPGGFYKKGEEKGYFSFGGSSLVMLFKKGKISFDKDLLDKDGCEIKALFGQSMGN